MLPVKVIIFSLLIFTIKGQESSPSTLTANEAPTAGPTDGSMQQPGLEPSQESVWLPEMTITDGVPGTSQEQRLEMSPFLPAELSQNSNRFEGDLRQPPPMPPHHGEFRDQCGPWQPWDNVTCWWPSTSWEQLPQSCKFLPIPEQLPPVLKSLIESKIREKYSALVAEYQKRGSPPLCGHCARSFACRARNETGSTPGIRPHFCRRKEVVPITADCNDTQACSLTLEEGTCPPPLFLSKKLIEKGAAELLYRMGQPTDQDSVSFMSMQAAAASEIVPNIRFKRQSYYSNRDKQYGDFDNFDSGNHYTDLFDKERRGPPRRPWERDNEFGPDGREPDFRPKEREHGHGFGRRRPDYDPDERGRGFEPDRRRPDFGPEGRGHGYGPEFGPEGRGRGFGPDRRRPDFGPEERG
ncbi:unnamed protein product, partial [Enterobius vermicularis]|uniref:C-type lectin domain-containing protein n=1 Tax=Enterobius vermicularis TaxID=51028 RepID=A0A0N4UTJ8_ENTVE